MSLVRLRANPNEVRIGVRRQGPDWRISISSIRDPSNTIHLVGPYIPTLMDQALWYASIRSIPGIDREMQWTYDHPQSKGE